MKKKIISIILVILWMLFIFIMSSFGSTESNSQSGFIVNIIASIFNITDTTLVTIIIRKLAHFGEYFILGLLVSNALNIHSKNVFFGIVICILYAISDEVHQLFVPGRSGEVLDVLIDSLGSLASIFLFYLLKVFRKKAL